jgi:hypothetical protein
MPKTPPPAASTTWRHILALRLARQSVLERAPRRDLVDVVERMVGLHAQVMSSAELQGAARIDGLRAADVREALWERRTLVKVWAFRQTLHLLTPDDLAELVVAARSLERWHAPAWLRYFDLTEADVDALVEGVRSVLSDRPMSREAVAEAVAKRIGRPHLREAMLTGWGTFLAPAAQRGALVFGPSEGRNVAFVNPSAWLGRPIGPATEAPAADEALGRMIVRYLTVFPGSSREMIARWWGGGRMAAITRALNVVPAPVVEVAVEGARGLVLESDLPALERVSPEHPARLLPGFDPFTNELPRRVESVLGVAHHDRVHRTAGWVTPIVVRDGRVAGTWQLGNGKRDAGQLVIQPFDRWQGDVRKELASEIERLAAFLDRPLKLELARVP